MLRNNKVVFSFCTIILAGNLLSACNHSKNLSMVSDINSVAGIQSLRADKSSTNNSNNYADIQTTADGDSIETFIIATERRIFDEYDTNRSGTIEPSELPDAPNSFNLLDRDKNKRLTFNEVMSSPQRIKQMSGWLANFYKGMYKQIDTDGNGSISSTELSSSKEMEPFKEMPFFQYSIKNIATKTATKSVNQPQFNIMMNNLFISLHKKFNHNRITPFTTKNGHLPVMLVQGYGEPSWYFMYGIYNDLKNNGWDSIYPINLFPNITDIREQAKIIAGKIEQAKKEQGVNKVDYVCHSMGGLIGRYYIQNLNGGTSIEHYISIATPHYGTYTSWLGIGEAAKQMRPGSDFLTKLNAGNPLYPNVKYTSMWTKTDEIVVPAENSLLRGSVIMPDIKYTGHLLVLWAPETYTQVKQSLNN